MRELREIQEVNDFNGRVIKSIFCSDKGLNILFENETELKVIITFDKFKNPHIILDDNDLNYEPSKFLDSLDEIISTNNDELPY